jgi:hypothetical protein
MNSKLPSGFKSRKEYNEYMKNYNRGYRQRKKTEETHHKLLLSHLKEIIAERDRLRELVKNIDKIVAERDMLRKVTRYTYPLGQLIKDYLENKYEPIDDSAFSYEVTQTNVNQ